MSKKKSNNIVAVDLFCGAGGLTRGMLDAGIDVVGGFDIAQDASFAYETNNIRPNGEFCRYFKQDISTVTSFEINNLIGNRKNNKFLLAGCAPCQPFSSQNRNKSPQDKRKILLLQFARLVEETHPDFVFMENVPGLQRLAPDVLEQFVAVLEKERFSFIDYGVVNAKWYGVPQNRKRFVLLASKEQPIHIPPPLYTDEKTFKTVKDAIGGLPPLLPGECSELDSLHRCAGLSDVNFERLSFIRHNREELPEHLVLNCHKKTSGHKDTYGRMLWNAPAPTLTTKFFSISNGRYAHPEQNRGISLREGAVLQTFPGSYKFKGSIQSIARQIGNAVPPLLAEKMTGTFIKK